MISIACIKHLKEMPPAFFFFFFRRWGDGHLQSYYSSSRGREMAIALPSLRRNEAERIMQKEKRRMQVAIAPSPWGRTVRMAAAMGRIVRLEVAISSSLKEE